MKSNTYYRIIRVYLLTVVSSKEGLNESLLDHVGGEDERQHGQEQQSNLHFGAGGKRILFFVLFSTIYFVFWNL